MRKRGALGELACSKEAATFMNWNSGQWQGL